MKKIKHPWSGRGIKPLSLRVVEDDELYSPDGVYRRDDYGIRPHDDYVVIRSDLPYATRMLFEFCRQECLLCGVLQFHALYYTDDEYRAFIDSKAVDWTMRLDAIDRYWAEDGTITSDYKKVKEEIRQEVIEFESALRMHRKKIKKRRYQFKGDGRADGRLEPDNLQKIDSR